MIPKKSLYTIGERIVLCPIHQTPMVKKGTQEIWHKGHNLDRVQRYLCHTCSQTYTETNALIVQVISGQWSTLEDKTPIFIPPKTEIPKEPRKPNIDSASPPYTKRPPLNVPLCPIHFLPVRRKTTYQEKDESPRKHQFKCPAGRKGHTISRGLVYLSKYDNGEQTPINNPYKNIGKRTVARYVNIKLSPDDPYYPMANSHGLILEHRYIMAKYLNRCLEAWEVVHHIDGNKLNNTFENLELLPNSIQHVPYTMLQSTLRNLKNKLEDKDKEITKLQESLTNNHFQGDQTSQVKFPFVPSDGPPFGDNVLYLPSGQ